MDSEIELKNGESLAGKIGIQFFGGKANESSNSDIKKYFH